MAEIYTDHTRVYFGHFKFSIIKYLEHDYFASQSNYSFSFRHKFNAHLRVLNIGLCASVQ